MPEDDENTKMETMPSKDRGFASPPPSMRKRQIAFYGKSGFPMGIYFDMIDLLERRGYEIMKVEDWLEVNPQSDFYEDVAQKKQSVEQQVGRVLDSISETRKQLELLRHDKRKLDRVVEHEKEGDLDVLKSDFVDLVDRNTEMSLLNLANSGRFPSIIVDFYKIESEEDIDELDVSKGERQILRKKWKLFQDWKKRYVGEIEKKKEMIESEMRRREESLESMKESLRPYAKAMKRIRLSEPKDYKGLWDPRIVERYPGSVSGVKLYVWKEIRELPARADLLEFEELPAGEQSYEYFIFLEITIHKKSFIVSGSDAEGIDIEVNPKLKHRDEIREKREEIQRKEKELFESIRRMAGEDVGVEEEEGTEEEGMIDRIKEAGKKVLLRNPDKSKPPHASALKKVIEEEVDVLYEEIKKLGGGIRIWKLRKGRQK